jgi:hypothetical protein
MFLLPPARADGLARDAGEPDRKPRGRRGGGRAAAHRARLRAVSPSRCSSWPRWSPPRSPPRWSGCWPGPGSAGHTGDVLGAAQQAAEIAVLLVFVASP